MTDLIIACALGLYVGGIVAYIVSFYDEWVDPNRAQDVQALVDDWMDGGLVHRVMFLIGLALGAIGWPVGIGAAVWKPKEGESWGY